MGQEPENNISTFHVIFKTDRDDFNSQGETFDGTDVIEALGVFNKKYPTSVFMCVYCLENTDMLYKEHLKPSMMADNNEAQRLQDLGDRQY